MFIEDKYHLTYCTNIHPGQDWINTFNSLKKYLPVIKNKLAKDQPLGVGLRLSNKASEELSEDGNLPIFKKWLVQNGLYVFTMNGFPYGNFHNEAVKDKVHEPDWTTKERVQYTIRLFEQLAYLLPDGISGGISTSPISYRHWHKSASEKKAVMEKGALHLTQVILNLYKLEEDTSKYLHLDIEPEPDGMLENTEDVLGFYSNFLLPIAIKEIADSLGVSEEKARDIVLRYCTLCYDICHFSLAYEEPAYTFKKLRDAGIKIGKIQVSAALKIKFETQDKDEIWKSLAQFDEPTYLHQVTEKTDDGVKTYNDLPVVLENKTDVKELRAHFHVPIFLESFDRLYSTQDHILKVISILKSDMVSEHLEIETYTWDVLPNSLKKELSESIIREMNWFKDKLH
ncbi:metabolite traffic protein EboE [uncultured Eudoraea sp.]|uniref:metabolite traffic protein EboE n=1 Tax=uncultured Eudoraea sp. TaxID=1035614 RepID=UPI002607B509|nr:metabolite traffic protein EboE [uncultured Eudoraea sp.]